MKFALSEPIMALSVAFGVSCIDGMKRDVGVAGRVFSGLRRGHSASGR
jgi:hypothetical protein